MAKNKTTVAEAAKKSNKVKKKKIVLESGKVLMIPSPTEDQLPFGLRRKTRNLKGEDAQEELFWLLLETFLTEKELADWDGISADEAAEAMSSEASEQVGK